MTTSLPRVARIVRSVRWAAFGAVFVMTVLALAVGVVTTERTGIGEESWLAWIYYAGSLFVFGGVDLGVPTGGPVAGRVLLWTAYFLAPTITTTAVAEAFLKLVRPRWFRRRLIDHVVIVGGGQIGRLYVNAVRSLDPGREILLADESDVSDEFPDVESVKLAGTQASVLEALQLERAAGLVLVTPADLVNLELAWSARSAHPNLRIAAHVGDLALLRPVERAAKGVGTLEGFNTHQVTAAYLYQIHLALHFESTAYRDVVVLAGFGRFGQTILELLLAEAGEDLDTCLLYTSDAADD